MDFRFSREFLLGAATSAYQVEGAVREDGRGASIWDVFSHEQGHVWNECTGDEACDHYHRYLDDVQLITHLGLNAYRFSIAWPRIFPEKGVLNQKGLAFYRGLLDALKERNITPVVTLYHWDLPQWIEDEGGWRSRDTIDYFVDYAETVFRELGDSVPLWITHNEPWCVAFLGHATGEHAPGRKNWHEAVAVAHHVLLSHGRTVNLYRRMGLKGQIGITLNLTPIEPGTQEAQDVTFAQIADGNSNRWFLDALFRGAYSEDMTALYAQFFGALDFIQKEDLQEIAAPIDFLGVNYYTRNRVVFDPTSDLFGLRALEPVGEVTAMGWEVAPESLYQLLCRVRDEYTRLPIYITENGAAYDDQLNAGEVHDELRIQYLRGHIEAASRFVQDGGLLKGYFVWSLLDNFEWAFGYGKRFGLVYVDYNTQVRTVKDSGKWLRDMISAESITKAAD